MVLEVIDIVRTCAQPQEDETYCVITSAPPGEHTPFVVRFDTVESGYYSTAPCDFGCTVDYCTQGVELQQLHGSERRGLYVLEGVGLIINGLSTLLRCRGFNIVKTTFIRINRELMGSRTVFILFATRRIMHLLHRERLLAMVLVIRACRALGRVWVHVIERRGEMTLSSLCSPPLLLPFGTKLRIAGQRTTIKCPSTGDSPPLRRKQKIVIPRRSDGIFDKIRRRADTSGVVGSIRSTFCLGLGEGHGYLLNAQGKDECEYGCMYNKVYNAVIAVYLVQTPPLLLQALLLRHKIADSGRTKHPRVKTTIYNESATMKRPFIDDAPRLRRETKIIIIPRRPHRPLDKLRRKGDLSGNDGPIGWLFCPEPAEGGIWLSS
ncbi:hypothetical protein BC629DRAFT_1439757 [Irpex lacteus]|nr:hypothetical protein BC629DRAFT_1439757 [Irpex lacteus]